MNEPTNMTPEERAAYDEALLRIETCHQNRHSTLGLSCFTLYLIPAYAKRVRRLTTLPSEIGQLTALTKLEICGHHISSLPSQIGDLTALKYLDLSRNELTMLPLAIGNLSSLNTLDLSGNRLTSLPDSIG